MMVRVPANHFLSGHDLQRVFSPLMLRTGCPQRRNALRKGISMKFLPHVCLALLAAATLPTGVASAQITSRGIVTVQQNSSQPTYRTTSSSTVSPVTNPPVISSQPVCPQCGQVHGTVAKTSNSFQSQAQAEAQMMASRSFKGHVRGTIPGVRFCGVGWSSSSPNAPTCTPRSGMTLVADAVARGRDGWYRVRYWR